MSFANPLPWWALVTVVAAAFGVAWLAYRHFAAAPARRYSLVALRFVTLLLLVVFLMRPVARSTDADARDAIVPILVDVSRSMGIEDETGGGDRAARRIDRARAIVADRLLPALQSRFHVEVLAFGEALQPAEVSSLAPTARRSDLHDALAAVRERHRGRAVAGIVLLSDGGDTSGSAEQSAEGGPAIYPIGVGAAQPGRDREILSVTAADAVLDDSRVDLAVSAVSHSSGVEPIELRLLENGRPIEVRRATAAAPGTPVHEVFQVSPPPGSATVYTVETPTLAGELVPENNVRSVLVQPPARPRRILLVEGAPGFEHSFLKRAWAADQGLEVDSVVRKGKNEQGGDTFYIQAARSRSDSLRAGYPATEADLFRYDALVLANVEGHQLTRAQLSFTRDFVSKRGGGLLVLGARSFLRQGLADTAVEDVLPLELSGRGGGVLPASGSRGVNRVALTPDGEAHPVMQLAALGDESRKKWESVPALASIAPLGGPRAGASVLAVTGGAGGTPRALVAVQRFGDGRAMVFTGEAAWRWRMMMPAANRSYDTFWRQAIRWLALPATDPLHLIVPASAAPGETVPLRIVVRDAAFQPQRDATVDLRIAGPDGRLQQVRAAAAPGESGAQFLVHFQPDQPGVYRITTEARHGEAPLGRTTSSMLVGSADLEMTDPRLNRQLLERVANASGGRMLSGSEIDSLPDRLRAAVPAAALSVRRDLWHTGWSFALIVVLLGAEWVLRRRWGLR